MELKKDSNTYNGPKDMDFDGMFDTPIDDSLKQTISEEKKHLSNDYSRSGTNTSYVGGQAAEWDEQIEKNAFRMSEEQMKKTLSKSDNEKTKERAKILLVTEILTYLAFAFLVYMIIQTTRMPNYDIPHNLKYISLGIMVLTIVLVFDAVMVFVLESRKVMLLVFALVLGVFYPIYRSKVVKGRIAPGLICMLLTAFAWVMLLVTAGQAVTQYGEALVYTEDEFTRHAAVELLDQNAENGKPLRIIIKNAEKEGIQKYSVTDKGDKREITVTGIGVKKVTFGSEVMENPNGLVTILTFARKKDKDPFTLKEVNLDTTKLNDKKMKQYWATMLGD